MTQGEIEKQLSPNSQPKEIVNIKYDNHSFIKVTIVSGEKHSTFFPSHVLFEVNGVKKKRAKLCSPAGDSGATLKGK